MQQLPQKTIFDPRVKLDAEEAAAKSVVWTTTSVGWAMDAIYYGQPITRSPFYEGNIDRRRGGIVFEYSKKELQEIVKCKKDIYYFLDKYCRIKTEDGQYNKFKLRKYQYQQIEDLLNNKYIVLGWSRQSGKTVGVSLYIVWKVLFNRNYSVAILANKGGTSGEVLDKVKNIFLNLPFFLQAGVTGWNGGRISLDNGSMVYTGPATLDALNGKTCNLLYCDEFAFVGNGANRVAYQKDFLANALPVISSQTNGQCVISSTPNGKDYFYELFDGSMRKQNQFKSSIVKWWEIPGKTQEWAEAEIQTLGIDKFRIQYELSFDSTSETLLAGRTLRRLNKWKRLYSNDLYEGMLSNYEQYLYMNPYVDIDFENDTFILSVDLAEGLRQDFSVVQILRVEYNEDLGEIFYRQVGIWASNEVSIESFADVVAELFNCFDEDRTKLLVEQNTYGDNFFMCMKQNSEHEVPIQAILKFKRNVDAKPTKGLRVNSQSRSIAITAFRDLMNSGKLIVTDSETIQEVENFQKNAKGKYEASIGHDDKVTPLTNFAYFVQLADAQLINWLEDFYEYNGYTTVDVNGIRSASKTTTLLDSEIENLEVINFDNMDEEIAMYTKQILGIET